MKSNDQMRGNRDYTETNIPVNQKPNEQQLTATKNNNTQNDKHNPASIKDLPEIIPARTGILG